MTCKEMNKYIASLSDEKLIKMTVTAQEDKQCVIFKKIPGNVPPLASKKLTIHSNSGNILLCFDGFDLPRISVMNYGDISAQEVAERLLTCWNKHVYESVEAIQGWK